MPTFNVVVGEVLVSGYTALTNWPTLTGARWAIAALTELVVGLAASKLYHATKALGDSRANTGWTLNDAYRPLLWAR